ncbi:MAG TPA: hypothetical protein VGI86_01025 [Acidimicrobiia bacterium]
MRLIELKFERNDGACERADDCGGSLRDERPWCDHTDDDRIVAPRHVV